jgi:pimeloyl-[acyl-carrier protein] methyl ester esterase
MHKKYKSVLVPGWAVMPELYSFNSDQDSTIYDFHFFKGDDPGNLLRFEDRMKILFNAPGILYAHSLGALLSLAAVSKLSNAKAMVIYSGFAKLAASGEDNIHGQAPESIAAMKKHLLDNPRRLLINFHRNMFHPQKSVPILPDTFNVAALMAGLDILSGRDVRPMLLDIQIPVLILHGREDRIVSPKIAEELAGRLKNSRLHIIGNAGHALPITHASENKTLIERFLSDHDIS